MTIHLKNEGWTCKIGPVKRWVVVGGEEGEWRR
jgi:hypothetical protein